MAEEWEPPVLTTLGTVRRWVGGPPLRESDRLQLWIVGFAFVFLLSVSSIAWAQSQDSINATLIERIAGLTLRLDRIETYISGIIVATLANLIAHVINIREARRDQK